MKRKERTGPTHAVVGGELLSVLRSMDSYRVLASDDRDLQQALSVLEHGAALFIRRLDQLVETGEVSPWRKRDGKDP